MSFCFCMKGVFPFKANIFFKTVEKGCLLNEKGMQRTIDFIDRQATTLIAKLHWYKTFLITYTEYLYELIKKKDLIIMERYKELALNIKNDLLK